MARSEYFTADENAVLFIRCRANRPLIPSPDQADANAGHRRVGYIEDLIRLYARHFAISVHAHAVTRDEIRLVLQSRPELLSALDDAQIARRWLSVCPTLRRGRALSDEPSEEEIRSLCDDPCRIAQLRHQLSDISWWMRLLQQRVAQLCNREDNQTGTLWQSRFRSVLLLDAMSHLAAIANVDLAAVRVQMGKPISASTFTSDVYRRMELQSESEVHPSSLQSDSPGVSNNSAAALPEVFTDIATSVRRDGRHLAPIFPSDEVANIAARLAGWINQLRCSEDSVLNMKLRNYIELLERTALGCPSDHPELSSLNLPPILRSLRLTFDQWVLLAGQFDALFSHVAGQLAAMDACVSKRSKRRTCVRPAARSLLQFSNAC
jgi:hypothetical protein